MMIELVAGCDKNGITLRVDRQDPFSKARVVHLVVPEMYGTAGDAPLKFLSDLTKNSGERPRLRALLESLLGPAVVARKLVRLEIWNALATTPVYLEFLVPDPVRASF